MGTKHCRKRRNCSLRAISPFPLVFSRVALLTHKTRACLGKGERLDLKLAWKRLSFLKGYKIVVRKLKKKMLVSSIVFSHNVFKVSPRGSCGVVSKEKM